MQCQLFKGNLASLSLLSVQLYFDSLLPSISDEKILVEVHREEDESGGESESWLSGPSQTTQSQTTGQSKSKSDLAEDYPGIFSVMPF